MMKKAEVMFTSLMLKTKVWSITVICTEGAEGIVQMSGGVMPTMDVCI